LTDQVIKLLLTDPFDCVQAQEVGVKLVDLHYIEPEALGNTQKVLMDCFSADITPDDLVALQPRLAVLLSEIAIGFSRHAREVMLAEQEAIRRAWCNKHTRT